MIIKSILDRLVQKGVIESLLQVMLPLRYTVNYVKECSNRMNLYVMHKDVNISWTIVSIWMKAVYWV